MPFILKERLAEVQRIERYKDLDEDLNEKYNKARKNIEKAYSEREEDLQDDLHKQLRDGKRALATDLERKEDQIAELKRENKKLEDAIDEQEEAAEILEAKLLTQDEIINQATVNDQAATQVKNDRTALDADIKNFEARVKKIEAEQDLREKAITDKKAGAYKEGYTDGVSDTLREAQTDVKAAVQENLKMATNVVDKALGKETTIVVATAAQNTQKQNNQKQ